jgi:hypothetical protein
MAQSVEIPRQPFLQTRRRDAWWVAPVLSGGLLALFGVYAFWAALQNAYYYGPPGFVTLDALGRAVDGPYLTPFYSPLFLARWWPLSPAFLILWAPLGFRATCYYYRKTYYRAFFMDPLGCAVGEPRHGYRGETALPFILQNAHRFFLYLALIVGGILFYDALLAFRWPDGHGGHHFGFGVGTLIMLINSILINIYSFSCHSLRHLVGGRVDCFSCTKLGQTRFKAWRAVTRLNENHGFWATISMLTVGLTDVYLRLVAMGKLIDYHWIF